MADQQQERENQDMTGALFVNDQKTKPGQPDYRGNIVINGVKHWLAGWKKQAKGSGKNFLSIKAEKDGEKPPAREPQREQRSSRREEEQDEFFNQ